MKIINTTNNATLAANTAVADTLFKRMKGLLGRSEFPRGDAVVITPCNSIHTFFMRFAIDVLFVNKDNRILAAKSGLLPFRISPVYFKAKFVIELPAGVIQATQTLPGHLLSFVD